MKTWFSIELTKENADILKDYLNKAGVYFEPSEAGNLIHFEVLMTNDERRFANAFLQSVVFKEVEQTASRKIQIL